MVAASGTFAGWDYRITREQLPGLVDCSSLVSQAHWLGAAIGMPFIAETQRIAYSGADVAAGDLRPGDVLVRHLSRAAAPGGRHNHVVLYLGEHPELGPSIIESAPDVGVRVRPLSEFDGLGGVRRFVLSDAPDFPQRQVAAQLAAAVPKLGRLGSRLTAGLDEPRRHRGVDVLLKAVTEIRAPIDGTATYLPLDPRGHDGAVAIRSEDGAVSVVLRHVRWSHVQPSVRAGDPLGLSVERRPHGCNAWPRYTGLPRLHVEFWSAPALSYFGERGITSPDPDIVATDAEAYNPVYAVKLGLIRSPVPDDAPRSVWPGQQ